MKPAHHIFKVATLTVFLAVGIHESIAQYPPAGVAPVYPSAQQGYYAPVPGAQYIAPGAPPPLEQEVIIAAPSPLHVWTPGYWHWQDRWVWIPGQWVLPPRPGARWRGPEWVPHEGNRYRFEHGGWR